jgi:hypothetical protein
VAICLAAALSLGIYSVKLAIACRADHPALPGNARQGLLKVRQLTRGWQRKVEDPIPMLNGRSLVTLRDAATDATELSKKYPSCRNGRPRSQR